MLRVVDGGTSKRGGRVSAPQAWRWLPELMVGAVAVMMYGWRVGVPSMWRDEAVTLGIARRGIGQIFALTRHVDVVHLAYYLVAHIVVGWQDSVVVLRWISVLAMAAAAVLLADLGRRLGAASVGVTAGLLLAISPLASRYAQEARPFALVVLVAVVATDLLVSAAARPAVTSRWVWYVVSLILLCVLNVLALLLLSAHGAWILLRGPAPLRRRWIVAASSALLATLPLLAFAYTQRAQVAWTGVPRLYDLDAVFIRAFGSKLVPVAVVLVAIGLALAGLLNGRRRAITTGASSWLSASSFLSGLPVSVDRVPAALLLGGCWAVVPPVVLWTVSQASSFWDVHYLLYAVPGLALFIAALLQAATARIGVRAVRVGVAVAAVVAVAAAGLPAQLGYRDPATGHGEDVRGAIAYLDTQIQPGDAILYAPYKLRALSSGYTASTRRLRDVALVGGPVDTATITGVEVDADGLASRLTGVRRIWLMHSAAIGPAVITPTDRAKFGLPQLGYTLAQDRRLASITLDLYTRAGGGVAP